MRQIHLRPLTEEDIDRGLAIVKRRLMSKIEQNKSAQFPFASIPEALGEITEEYYETLQAAHAKDVDAFMDEACDLAVTSMKVLISGNNNVRKIDK